MIDFVLITTTVSFVIAIYLAILPPIKIKISSLKLLWYFELVVIAFVAFYGEPDNTLDLSRYYDIINSTRKGYMDVFSSYMPFGANLLFYILSISSVNGLLPMCATFLWGFCVGSVIFDYLKSKKNKLKITTHSCILYLTLLLGGGSIFYLFTTIRNPLAFAIWLYGYYFYANIKNKKYLYFIISFIALGIHSSVLLLIGLELYYSLFVKKINNKYVNLILLVLLIQIIMYSPLISFMFEKIGLNWLSIKFSSYQQGYSGSYWLERVIRLCCVLTLLIIEVLMHYNSTKIQLSFVLISVTFVAFFNPIFYERLIRLVSIVEIFPLLTLYSRLKNNTQRICFYYLLLPVFFSQLYFDIYSYLAHTTFDKMSYINYLRPFSWLKGEF